MMLSHTVNLHTRCGT